MAELAHGYAIKSGEKSGSCGIGPVGRTEGRAGKDGQHDAGTTQGRSAQSGASTVVKKNKKTMNRC